MNTVGWILTALMWLAFIVTMVVTIVKDCKAMKAIKSRRKLLDEVNSYLHDEVAVCGKRLEGHEEFMDRFWKRFENDMW